MRPRSIRSSVRRPHSLGVSVPLCGHTVLALLLLVPESAGAWPVLLGDEVHSSPIVADLEPDGVFDLVVFSSDGRLHVLDPAGIEHAGAWPLQLGPSSAIPDGQNWVSGSAALVNIDADPALEILQAGFDGKLHALTPLGQEKPGFPIVMGTYCTDSPTVVDLDLDDDMEIICRYNPNLIAVWSHTGQMLPGWPRAIANAPGGAIDVWSSAAVPDLDADTDREIVVGSYDGFCHAYHHTGAPVAGWPVNLNPSGGYPGWVLSSPAVTDFDGDGRDEVVIGSDDNKLWVLRGDGTSFIPGVWPRELPFGFRASPALADLDHDLDLEIVIGHRSNVGDLRLYAIHHTGQNVAGWPIIQAAGGGGYTFGWLSPVLTDLNGDWNADVIAIKERRVADPSQAEIYAFRHDGTMFPGFPIPLQGLAYGMPTVCDLDRDGLAEVVVGDLTRRIYKIDLALAIDLTHDGIEWTRLQKDLGNTGRFDAMFIDAAPEELGDGDQAPAAMPNPFAREVRITGARQTYDGPWRVVDVRGREVRTVWPGPDGTLLWTGDGSDGAPSATGVYWIAPAGRPDTAIRVLRLR